MDGLQIRERFDALQSQRETLDNTFQFIEKYVVPMRGEFFKPLTSMLEIDWRRREIFDSTAPVACDILASKIHTNLTSPSIRWFELRFRNEQLNDQQGAKEWLEEVQNNIWQALLESDFNMEVAEVYLDLCSFGTAVLFEEELNEEEWEGIAFTAVPVRDAYFEMGADDNLLRVYRRLQYTLLQLEDKFPDYDFDLLNKEPNYNVDTKYDVVFCIYKRDGVDDDDGKKRKPEARPYAYKYVMHRDSSEIEEGGYYQMPAFVSRWKKVSGSQWGHSPATICLSDILQLNEVVASTSEARIKEVNPPMKSTERGLVSDLDLSMGGLTMVTDMDELDRLLPPNPMAWSDVEIERLQKSIRSVFFIDKLELKESPAMTAYETAVRLQLMMELFAPTLGRLQADLLDPLVQLTYSTLGRAGRLPLPPQGLEGADLEIEYTGPIPRAQKNERGQAISTWIGEMANLDALAPGLNMLDIADADAIARGLGKDRGVPFNMMRSEDEVAQIRQQRAEAQEEARQMEMLQQAGKTMKDMGIAGEESETVQ
jgi:hypothetical protein